MPTSDNEGLVRAAEVARRLVAGQLDDGIAPLAARIHTMISGPLGLALARQQTVIDLATKRMQFDVAPIAAQLQIFNDQLADQVRPIVAHLLDTSELLGARIAAQLHSILVPIWEWRNQLLPSNLVELDPDELKAAAAVSLDDGIPVAWVPSVRIVRRLLDAADRSERMAVLLEHAQVILDECEAAMVEVGGSWSERCREAIGAYRAGFIGPAQSHAANLVVLRVFAPDPSTPESGPARHLTKARKAAKNGGRGEIDDVSILEVSDNLTLRPVVHALAQWFPGDTDQFPELFSRHVTAHAIGEDQATGPEKALVAVMLATSILCEFPTDQEVCETSSIS
jgi:hypothetical protein